MIDTKQPTCEDCQVPATVHNTTTRRGLSEPLLCDPCRTARISRKDETMTPRERESLAYVMASVRTGRRFKSGLADVARINDVLGYLERTKREGEVTRYIQFESTLRRKDVGTQNPLVERIPG